MATLLEMAADIVSSHASTSAMTTDQLLQELQKVHESLKSLEAGLPITTNTSPTTGS
jgi:predicted transcriptional regulator